MASSKVIEAGVSLGVETTFIWFSWAGRCPLIRLVKSKEFLPHERKKQRAPIKDSLLPLFLTKKLFSLLCTIIKIYRS
jgi:hypothetical protein